MPLASTSHVCPVGTQTPNWEQDSPSAHPPEPGSQATQRCSAVRHRVLPSVQPPHSLSVSQVWSRQTSVPVGSGFEMLPPVLSSTTWLAVAQAAASSAESDAMTAKRSACRRSIEAIPALWHGPGQRRATVMLLVFQEDCRWRDAARAERTMDPSGSRITRNHP